MTQAHLQKPHYGFFFTNLTWSGKESGVGSQASRDSFLLEPEPCEKAMSSHLDCEQRLSGVEDPMLGLNCVSLEECHLGAS